MKALLKNDEKIQQAHRELDRMCKKLANIAKIWDGVGFLPPMDQPTMAALLRCPNHGINFMLDQVWQHYVAYQKKQHGVIAKALKPELLNMHELFDHNRITLAVEGILNRFERITGPDDISWKDGKPYVADSTRKRYEDMFTAFDSEQNKKVVDAAESVFGAVELLNDLHLKRYAKCEARKPPLLKVKNDGGIEFDLPLIYGKTSRGF